MPSTKKIERLIDNKAIREKLAKLQELLLHNLEEDLEDNLLESPDKRLLWEMLKAHQIGFPTMDEMVVDALQSKHTKVEDIELPDGWDFSSSGD